MSMQIEANQIDTADACIYWSGFPEIRGNLGKENFCSEEHTSNHATTGINFSSITILLRVKCSTCAVNAFAMTTKINKIRQIEKLVFLAT